MDYFFATHDASGRNISYLRGITDLGYYRAVLTNFLERSRHALQRRPANIYLSKLEFVYCSVLLYLITNIVKQYG